MRKIILCLATIICLGRTLSAQDQNFVLPKIEGKKISKTQIWQQEGFEYLNNKPSFEEDYQYRYDYLKKHLQGVKHIKSTALVEDTSSRTFNNYFLDIHPSYYTNEIIPISYIKTIPVSNQEWNDFQQYVYDSIVRNKILEETGEELMINPRKDLDNEKIDNELCPFNWKFDIDRKYDKSKTWRERYQHDLILYPSNQFYRNPEIDARKLNYQYAEYQKSKLGNTDLLNLAPQIELDQEIHPDKWNFNRAINIGHLLTRKYSSTFVDSTIWMNKVEDKRVGSIAWNACCKYFNVPQYENSPVIGINSQQAQGYLHWLQVKHQQKIDEKKLPYYVEYSLPTVTELKLSDSVGTFNHELNVPEFDLSAWKITNAQYKEFIEYVKDSILMRYLANEVSYENFLIPTYDIDGEEYDMELWKINWKNRKIILNDRKHLDEFTYPEYLQLKNIDFDIDWRKIEFEHYEFDLKQASMVGDIEKGKSKFKKTKYKKCERQQLSIQIKDTFPCFDYGKDYLLTESNADCQNADVRSHYDRSRFIHRVKTSVYPGFKEYYNGAFYDLNSDSYLHPEHDSSSVFENKRLSQYDFDSKPNDPVTNITYFQALAFYNWLKHVEGNIVENENPLIQNYIPSESEWNLIQNNQHVSKEKSVLHPETNGITYTVKFYPKTIFLEDIGSKIIWKQNDFENVIFGLKKDSKSFAKSTDTDLIKVINRKDDEPPFALVRNKKTKKWGVINEIDLILFQQYEKLDIIEQLNGLLLVDSSDSRTRIISPTGRRYFKNDLITFDGYEINHDKILVQKNKLWYEFKAEIQSLVGKGSKHKDSVTYLNFDRYTNIWKFDIEDKIKKGFISFKINPVGKSTYYAQNNNLKWGLFSYENDISKVIVPAKFDDIKQRYRTDNCALVWEKSKIGVYNNIDRSPHLTIPCEYDEIKIISSSYGPEKLALVKKENLWGLISIDSGSIIESLKYTFDYEVPEH